VNDQLNLAVQDEARTLCSTCVLVTVLLVAAVSCSCSFKSVPLVRTSSASPEPPRVNANQHQAEAKPTLPPPTGFVSDFANVLDPETKERLQQALTELKDKSDIEFAVVTVETTGGQPIFDYSLALAKEWGIGPKDTSQGGGILLTLAIKDRDWRIQISRSLEKDLPDEICKALGDQSRDLYRQGRYGEGITKYVKAIIERLEGLRAFKLDRKL
jgi:uncharacterized membrane protein YgcG